MMLGGSVVERGIRVVVARRRIAVSEGAESVAVSTPPALTPEEPPTTRPWAPTDEPATVAARAVPMEVAEPALPASGDDAGSAETEVAVMLAPSA
jgi:hypothetical protein